MYKISVPITLENIDRAGRDELLNMLREFDAQRVFIALPLYTIDNAKKVKILSDLKRHCDFFKAAGLEVGAWAWTFWVEEENDFTKVVAVSEEERVKKNICCPLDEAFLEFSTNYFADIARCGVDLIMFDDDLRYAFLGHDVGCLCDLHMQMIAEITGESLPRAELARRILSGEKNKYRDAWLMCNGHSFEQFAKRIRAKIDTVDPKIRIGACACMSSWDIDGTDAKRLAYLLAGKTKPFLRLAGAPYWGALNSWGNRLQDVIEYERMESAWTYDGEIEIFAEGDAYPRPRINCPASYLEGFDLAIRASGATDGILKYGIDYTSSTRFERGYATFHQMNKPLYPQVDNFFRDKSALGVRIYEFPQKVAGMDVGANPVDSTVFQYTFFCMAARSLAACSIPTVYEGDGVCGACFGQSARYLTPDMRKKGMILDGVAAMILHSLGVDVGIERTGREMATSVERFLDDGEFVATRGMKIFAHTFKDNVKALSLAAVTDGVPPLAHMARDTEDDELVPMSYLYENTAGERYLVLNFDTRYVSAKTHTESMRHYKRSEQYANCIPWLSRGGKLPAFCFGNPNLYTMVKEKDGVRTVGLWNFFADLIAKPTVRLDRAYDKIRFLNCTGELNGDTVILSNLPAYGFAAFEVK